MRIPYYQVNAFTSRNFGGNPAGVCLLDSWLPDPLLQQIAAENNLSETAFLVPHDSFFDLRWMTPEAEVDLCGHATLAAAHVLFFEKKLPWNEVPFQTASGRLTATRREGAIELDFPSRPAEPCVVPEALLRGLRAMPREVLKSRDYLAVFESAAQVAAISANFDLLAGLDCLGTIVTAPGVDVDFVSRFFAPQVGVPEDPVTGSAHSTLIPYWARRLGKTELRARQISKRQGELACRLLGDRVGISGTAVVYCRGELDVL
jgi:predicted PhzF superfamily epimerase YddE/YHI9